MLSRRMIVCGLLTMLAAAAVGSPSLAQERVKMEANLVGSTLASGKAKFESRGARRKFSVEVEDAAPNKRYRVVVRNSSGLVFRRVIRANQLGGFYIDLDTDLGNAPPTISARDRVLVIDIATRQQILTGRF